MCEPKIIRSKRKTIAIQIAPDGTLIVRAPLRMTDREIAAFVEKNRGWIEKHTAKVLQRAEAVEQLEPITSAELQHLAEEARRVIPARVQHYAAIIGVTYGRITIRNQRSKWGSCSAQGNLNFNCLLMAAPREVLDSVIVHELCHRKQMNHSAAFYEEVYRAYPAYDKWHGWLKTNGDLLLRRMIAGMAGTDAK